MVLLCLSDIHGQKAGLERTFDGAPDADAIVICGDLTNGGGYKEAREVLAPLLSLKKPVFAVRGNMDRDGVGKYLDEIGAHIHGRGVKLKGMGIHGLGGSNATPMGTPFEMEDGEARALLDAGLADIESLKTKILVTHAPPKGTKTDVGFMGRHVGSPVVRDFILDAKPAVCLSGHIHEAGGEEDALGGTRCFNVGPYKGGRFAVIRMDGANITVTWRTL